MVDSSFSTTSSNKSRKPKLADDNESTDSLRREAAKLSDQAETPRKISKLQTTETDMQWRYLANSDKMLDPFNAVSFNSKKDKLKELSEHSEKSDNSDSDKEPDDDSKDDNDKDANADNNNNVNDNEDEDDNDNDNDDIFKKNNIIEPAKPKPSLSGPSFGDGPACQEDTDNLIPHSDQLTNEERILRKLNILRKLGELSQYGIKLSQNYSMDSPYRIMKFEYDLHKKVRDKQNGIQLYSSIMLNCVYALEFFNEKYDVFKFKLKGWSEQVNSNITSYYDIFGDLYEKYHKDGKNVAPELRLLFMLGASAVQFHFSKAMMEAIPSMKDSFQQNPGLLQELKNKFMGGQKKVSPVERKEADHSNINKQVSDLQMLQNQKATMEEQRRKQEQLKQLNAQLNNQQNQGQTIMQAPKMPGQFQMNSYPTVAPTTGQQQENFRQTEIFRHQLQMQQMQQMAKLKKMKEENEKINLQMDNISGEEKSTKPSSTSKKNKTRSKSKRNPIIIDTSQI